MEDGGSEAEAGECEEGAGVHREPLEAGEQGSPLGPPGGPRPANTLTLAEHIEAYTRHTSVKPFSPQLHQFLAGCVPLDIFFHSTHQGYTYFS